MTAALTDQERSLGSSKLLKNLLYSFVADGSIVQVSVRETCAHIE